MRPSSLPYVLEVVQRFPKLKFVLDHAGHNSGGEDLEEWGSAIDALAACPNVCVKIGASEQWGVTDPLVYMERALRAFGWGRSMAESNWFVCVAEKPGLAYDRNFELLDSACDRLGASEEDKRAVFCGNAERVYRIGPSS